MQVVIIGLGSMGKRRIRLLQVINSKLQIIGVDKREDRRKDTEESYSIVCVSEIPGNLHQDTCAFICTDPISHFVIIKDCLLAGYHIFTELNLLWQGHDELLQLAAEKKRVLFVSSTPLYKSEMKHIIAKMRTEQKPIQYIYHVGQYLPDWHPWERIEEFFVSNEKTNGCREILAIELPWMTQAFGKITKVECTKRKLTNLKITCDDTYTIQLVHENGNAGIFVVDIVCRHPVRHLEIYNENLYITWNGKQGSLEEKNMVTKEMIVVGDQTYLHQTGYGEFINEFAYISELEEFFRVLSGDKPKHTMEQEKELLTIIDIIEGYGH